MRNTRGIRWLGHEARRVILAGGLCFCGWGCHQHHYYYQGAPTAASIQGCPPATILPSTVSAAGPVCDVPADGGPVITSNASSSNGPTTTISDGRKSRVVVSEPSINSKSSYSWRASDPEATATTQVEGAVTNSSVRR